jgi:uncharacterized protein (TIRG00374 family)
MKLLFKVFVTLILVIILLFNINWKDISVVIKQVAWWIIPLSILMQLLVFYIATLRWSQLLKIHDINLKSFNLYRYYLIGSFFNNFLPTSFGGDIYRIYFIYKNKYGLSPSIMPIIFERLMGAFCLAGISSIALLTYNNKTDLVLAALYSIAGFFSILLLVFLLFYNGTTYLYIKNNLKKYENNKFVHKIILFVEIFHQYVKNIKLIIKLIILSVLIHLVVISLFFLLGYGIGSDFIFLKYLQTIPIVFMIAALPITIGGLGVREITTISILIYVGMSNVHAAAISVLFLVTLIGSSSIGLFFFLRLNESGILKNEKTIKNALDNM